MITFLQLEHPLNTLPHPSVFALPVQIFARSVVARSALFRMVVKDLPTLGIAATIVRGGGLDFWAQLAIVNASLNVVHTLVYMWATKSGKDNESESYHRV